MFMRQVDVANAQRRKLEMADESNREDGIAKAASEVTNAPKEEAKR